MRRIALFLSLALPVLLSGCAFVRPVHLPVALHQPPYLQPKKPIKVALVLGSGGVRSVAQAGVIKVLAGAGVPIDAIVGTSAGSIVGALYASNPDPRALKKIMLDSKRRQIIKFNFFNFNRGMVSGYTLQRYLINRIPTGLYFKNLKIPLGVIATDFLTGKPYFINSGVIAPAVNASSAIPGIFKVVHLYGKSLVDGGVSAPIGAQQARQFYKPKLIIVVSIHVDLGPKLPKTMLGKMGRALNIVETHLERARYRFADIIIHPRVGDVGPIDAGSNKQLYAAGVRAGKRVLPVVLRKMKALGIARVAAR